MIVLGILYKNESITEYKGITILEEYIVNYLPKIHLKSDEIFHLDRPDNTQKNQKSFEVIIFNFGKL